MTKNLGAVRMGAAAAAVVAAGLAGSLTAPATAMSTAPATTPAGISAQARPMTTLTFAAPDCNGCRIRLVQALWGKDGGPLRVWESRQRTVRHGKVSYRLPTRRTHGLSMMLRAPWERRTGYVTNVVFRYAGLDAGDRVGFHEARGKRRGSACWAGTRRHALTIGLATRKVSVPGLGGPGRGTLAYAKVTRAWMPPMWRVFRGVAGTQDVNVCGRH
jgi:hypothetical protein